MTNNSFKSAVRIPKLTQPFTLQEIKNRPFAPALAPANPYLPVKPEIACFKSELEQKKFYESKGYSYLLPKEVWSERKIFDAIKRVGEDLDRYERWGVLSKVVVQKSIDKVLPEKIRGKIIVKGYDEFENCLKEIGYSPTEIKMLTDSNGATLNEGKVTTMFLKFKDANNSKCDSIPLKVGIEHELFHALSMRCQNKRVKHLYENTKTQGKYQNNIFDQIFHKFEYIYPSEVTYRQTELEKQDMLDWLGYDSIEELHESFEDSLNCIIRATKATGNLILGLPEDLRQFFAYLKFSAAEEKNAHGSKIRYRELYNDPYTPTDAEFIPMLYEEMERFFAKKEAEVGKF